MFCWVAHIALQRERERKRNRHQRITKSHAYFIIYLFCVRFFFCIILLGPPKQPVIFFLRRYNFDSKNCYRCPLIYFFSYPFRLMHLFLIIAEKKQIIAIKQLCIAPSVYVNGVQNILTLDTNTFVLLLLRFCFVFSWIFPIWFFAVAFSSSSSLFLINFNSLWIVLNICVLFVVFFSSQMISVHDYDKDYIDDRKHTTNQSLFFTVYFSSFSSIKGPILFVLLLFQFRRLWQNKKKRIIIIKKKLII